jgi:hypothetical protein
MTDTPANPPSPASRSAAPGGRKLVAMRFGDHCWLKGLTARPTLNGKHVVLRQWHDDRQRWECEPEGWTTHDGKTLAVRPANLDSEPPTCTESAESRLALGKRLEELMQREGELRQEKENKDARGEPPAYTVTTDLKYHLCAKELAEVQLDLLCKADGVNPSFLKEAEDKVHEQDAHVQSLRQKMLGVTRS